MRKSAPPMKECEVIGNDHIAGLPTMCIANPFVVQTMAHIADELCLFFVGYQNYQSTGLISSTGSA
jgi:hypothetical protein